LIDNHLLKLERDITPNREPKHPKSRFIGAPENIYNIRKMQIANIENLYGAGPYAPKQQKKTLATPAQGLYVNQVQLENQKISKKQLYMAG
jgi:hypothetical protein